jgi:hypothetical protein
MVNSAYFDFFTSNILKQGLHERLVEEAERSVPSLTSNGALGSSVPFHFF